MTHPTLSKCCELSLCAKELWVLDRLLAEDDGLVVVGVAARQLRVPRQQDHGGILRDQQDADEEANRLCLL